ncbi:MAG: glycoside hydrolase family 4, partial [Oligosphaeraceae bacterium]|nr:glycoside hydrolase family 4 [Oligosphaeraceae bacterium]
TWVVKCSYDGQDLMPKLREFVHQKAVEEYTVRPNAKAKPRLNFNYAEQLMDIYGAYPTAPSHTKEYVPFFQGYGVSPVIPEPLTTFDAFNRAEEMAAAWQKTTELADGKLPMAEFFQHGHGDHATDIIESMWGNLGKQFYINCPNHNAVDNLPPDAFLELLCDLDLNGPRPRPVGALPRGILGLTQQVLDTHELTAQAAVTCDRQVLLRAMMTDPLVNNIGDAKNIIAELLEGEREHLPQAWFN